MPKAEVISITTRRTLLAGSVAGSTATAPPAAAAMAEPDPHPAWAAQHACLVALCEAAAGREDVVDRLAAQAHRLDLKIATTPAAGLAGLREQLCYVRRDIRDNTPEEITFAALDNALATIDRLAGRA